MTGSYDVMTVNYVAVVLLQVVCLTLAALSPATYTESKCFGNLNNATLTTLLLSCHDSHVIQVMSVSHGVKPKSQACDSPAKTDTYRPACCLQAPGDCVLTFPVDIMAQCNGVTSCSQVAGWQTTYQCEDSQNFPIGTNYMKVEYVCIPGGSSTTTGLGVSSSTQPTPVKTTHRPTQPTGPTPTSTDGSARPDRSTPTQPGRTTTPTQPTQRETTQQAATQQSLADEDELSSGMVTAIIGASIGMLLIIVIFACYTGRRRTLRVEGKPQPSVWDYLLPTTFTVRGERGYDHFHNRRSVNSTTSSEGSTIGGGNTTWQPNIVPEPELPDDDGASVYDNNEAPYQPTSGRHGNHAPRRMSNYDNRSTNTPQRERNHDNRTTNTRQSRSNHDNETVNSAGRVLNLSVTNLNPRSQDV